MALPRGICPDCGADVALRKGGLVREHRNKREPRTRPFGVAPMCSGAGKPAKETVG